MKSWITHNSKKLCFIISHLKEESSPCTKPALTIPLGNDCQQGNTPLNLGSTLSSQGIHWALPYTTSSSDINCDTSLAYVVIICKVAMVGASPIQNILGHLSEITFKAFTGLDSPDLKMNIS